MSQLTKEEVLKLAQLARLRLSDAEVEQYAKELNAILGYVEQLSDVDTKGLKPTDQVTGLQNVMRPDTVREYTAGPAKLLAQTPDKKDQYIKVHRMI